MTYTLYYVKHEPDGTGTDNSWSVYSEQYESIDDTKPIEGSTVRVSGNHPTPRAANIEADAKQRASYAATRQENSHGART